MNPTITALDHLVLSVTDIQKTLAFYQRVLGMTPEKFEPVDGSVRWALKFGSQKINLHLAGAEFDPRAKHPTPGSGDLCFLSKTPVADLAIHFDDNAVLIDDGPVERTGATGPLLSVYVRDPDGNLIEISNEL